MTIMSKTKMKKAAKKRDLLSVYMKAKLPKKSKICDPITDSPVDVPWKS